MHYLLARSGHVDIAAAERLLASKVGINDFDEHGDSPLAIYMKKSFLTNPRDKTEMIELLFQAGADRAFATAEERLGLGHLSTKSHNLDMDLLKILRKSGVDLRMLDSRGRTVLHHCAITGCLNEDALNFLCDEMGLSKIPLTRWG